MQSGLNVDHVKRVSLILSSLFSLAIAFIATFVVYKLTDTMYSIKNLIVSISVWFFLLIWATWLITDKFMGWMKIKQIHPNRRDYILLLIALIPMIAAIYSVWSVYSDNSFPNTLFSSFEVEIGPFAGKSPSGNICILEIKTQNGIKIQPENNPTSGFVLTGDWKTRNEGCQYYSQGGQESLKFHYAARPGDVFYILFRENKDGGNAFVRINGEQVAQVDLRNVLEGNQQVSAPLQPSRRQIFLWYAAGTAGWTAILVLLVMIAILTLRKIPLPVQVASLLELVQKYQWISLVPLGIMAAVMFWPPGVFISPDVGYYLSLAKNLYYGNGYVNPDLSPNIYRGPVFPLLISLSYVFFGESLRSAVIVERIFWFLTILISYVLGRQLYNHRVGFLTASFILAAGVINQSFIRIWTDGPLTFGILALQLMIWQAFIGQRDGKWYALMGVLLGITYLLKQTVIFIAPLPFLTWIVFSEYRTHQTLKRLLVFYLVFAVFYFGWEGYVYLAGGSLGQITGTLQTGLNFMSYISRGSSLADTGQNTAVQGGVTSVSALMKFFEILSTFYTRDILRFFKIGIVFPIAMVFLLYQAIARRTKPDLFLAMGCLLYFPLILVQAVVNFGFRQNLYFFCIALLCIAAMLDRMFGNLSSKRLSNVVVMTAGFSLIGIQISGGNYNFPQLVSLRNVAALPYLSNYYEIADWVDTNTGPDTKIMIPTRESNFLHILTEGNRQFETLYTCMGEVNFSPAIECTPPYISFWVYRGTTDPNEPRDFFQGISEPVLLSTIQEKDIEYIFVTPSIHSLYSYLVVHPDFEEVDIISNIAIFRVIRAVPPIAEYQNVEWEPCIGMGTSEYLKNLQETDPARFEMRLQRQIEPWMGLNQQDLDNYINWQGCQFEVNFPGTYGVE